MVKDEAIKSISFQSDKTRRQILLSYWVVALLAIPLWWITTSITRLSLPEGRVKALSSKQLHFPLHASIEDSVPESVVEDVERRLRRRIHELGLDENFSVDFFRAKESSDQVEYLVSLDTSATETRVVRRELIVGTKAIAPDSISEAISNTLASLWLESFGPDHRIVQFSPRYRLAFSLLNEDTSAKECPLSWDVRASIGREIQPSLGRLSALHNFTLESQIQYFAPLAFQPVDLEDGSFGLTQEQLSVFINSAEWTLSSSVSNDPVLHFVIFVPSANRRPLRILDAEGAPTNSHAFVMPQWGSIFIHNPESGKMHLTSEDLRPSFTIFRKQLMSLLGAPSLPPAVKSAEVLSDWTLDALLRRRAYENTKGSKETLNSIVNLVHQIEGMPVDKDVTEDIRSALDALDKTYEFVQNSPQLALQYSARAFTRASRAFFNPGMLALLYFPPEHNLAVYTPLLAPVAVPLIFAVFRELARWRKSRQQETS